KRFTRFFEGLASPDVRPEEAAKRRFVEIVNILLSKCGAEMRETGMEGGYPDKVLVYDRPVQFPYRVGSTDG
ncbi:MAG TPA: hypothetical protein VJG13_07150, partial [Thermoanaerobaculia bacterium]|nr:hypothetical protein [Thermoanaerobaculia bacterium]